MILHSNYETSATDLISVARWNAIDAGSISRNVFIAESDARGSRTHKSAVEFRLEFLGDKVKGDGRRWRNSGRYGAESGSLSATWDEHGHIMAHVFALDAGARFGTVSHPVYNGAEDFHTKTGGAYRIAAPAPVIGPWHVFTRASVTGCAATTWHALRDEMRYDRTNFTVCGRPVRGVESAVGDDGARPLPVTCAQCNRAPERVHAGSGALQGPWPEPLAYPSSLR